MADFLGFCVEEEGSKEEERDMEKTDLALHLEKANLAPPAPISFFAHPAKVTQ